MAVKPYNGDAKEAVPLFTEDEKRFLEALEAALTAAKKSPVVDVTRMANKALSVRSRHGYLIP